MSNPPPARGWRRAAAPPPARDAAAPAPRSSAPSGSAAAAGAPPRAPGTGPGVAARDAHAPVRLNKRMAELGLASRREADEWIAKGWVRVDGQVAQLGQTVLPQARIEVQRSAREQQAQQVTILLHKPIGVVSGQAEDGNTPAITLIQPHNRWKEDRAPWRFAPAQLRHLVPAGRLDVDSTGLLVLTQDGRVARQLIGEDTVMEKEYLVRVAYTGQGNARAEHDPRATYAPLSSLDSQDGPVREDVRSVFPTEKLALLRHGLTLDGQPLQRAQVEWQNPEQLRFVLTEGKKRQIRRMCEQVGLKVLGLKRVRIGRVLLGQLPAGQWRYLQPHEAF
ncbi:MAG: pseudouridine synthase [Rhodoferax sp.]